MRVMQFGSSLLHRANNAFNRTDSPCADTIVLYMEKKWFVSDAMLREGLKSEKECL